MFSPYGWPDAHGREAISRADSCLPGVRDTTNARHVPPLFSDRTRKRRSTGERPAGIRVGDAPSPHFVAAPPRTETTTGTPLMGWSCGIRRARHGPTPRGQVAWIGNGEPQVERDHAPRVRNRVSARGSSSCGSSGRPGTAPRRPQGFGASKPGSPGRKRAPSQSRPKVCCRSQNEPKPTRGCPARRAARAASPQRARLGLVLAAQMLEAGAARLPARTQADRRADAFQCVESDS